MTMSIAQAFANWQAEIQPHIPAGDVPMLSESWNDYTDALCKDGELNALQYHYCPAYDDEMPDEGTRFDALAGDREFILESMGVTIRYTRTEKRTDRDGWDKDASHWLVTIKRREYTWSGEYSMGSAHTGGPELADVMNSLLRDSESAEESFEDWCSNLDMDTDSRRALAMYDACKQTARQLGAMFTAGELEGLRELFEDF